MPVAGFYPWFVLRAQPKAPWVMNRTEPSDAALSPWDKASHKALGSTCIVVVRRTSSSHGSNVFTNASNVAAWADKTGASITEWCAGLTLQLSGLNRDATTSIGWTSRIVASSRTHKWKRYSPGFLVGLHTW